MVISADFPFESKYVEVHGSTMHYIEQGEGPVFLFLHGNPTWSYLWRNVIPVLSKYGRCIALDLIGFGKSDRPDIGYKFHEHYHFVDGFIEKMGLKDIVIVGHDWGGVIGFYYAMRHQENVKGIAFMETFPFTIKWDYFPPNFRRGIRMFRTPLIGQFLIMVLNVFVEKILPASVHRRLPKEVHDNYRKMFPTVKSRYPVYVWPNELPIEGRENETFLAIKRVEEALPRFGFPMLLLTATPGAIIKPDKVKWFKKTIQNLTVKNIGNGIHYLQEDNPKGIANGIITWAIARRLAVEKTKAAA